MQEQGAALGRIAAVQRARPAANTDDAVGAPCVMFQKVIGSFPERKQTEKVSTMYKKISLASAAGLLCTVAGLAVPAAPAMGAQAAAIEEITVVAERPTSKIVGRTSIGAAVELIELRERIRYADLDLATPSGASSLEKRVSDAAKAACDDLDKLYPLEAKDANCAKKAADAAMPQVRAAVSAAEARAKATSK